MTTYYFCDNGTGAAGTCVPGNDTTNTGLSPSSPFRTLSKFVTLANSAAPGDQFLFSKGGAWNSFSALLRTTNGTMASFIANPVIIGSYNPTQFSSSAAPRLNLGAGASGNPVDSAAAFRFTNSTTTQYGGYDISGFLIDGGTTNQFNSACTVWGVASYINLHDCTIQNTYGFFGASADATGGAGGKSVPTGIIVRNNIMTDCIGMGVVLWGCANTIVEGNTLTRAANNTTIALADKRYDHAMYISGDETANTSRNSTNIVIRNNIMIDSCFGSTDYPNGCGATVITGHARGEAWVIENNLIKNSTKAAMQGWGIQITPNNGTAGQSEYEKQLTIRGNTVINVGYVAIDIQNAFQAVVENNVVVQEFAGEYIGIRQGDSGWGLSIPNSGNYYRNNSIYIADSDNNDCYGLQINSVGSGGHVVSGNLVVYGSSASHSSRNIVGTNISVSGFVFWNNNLGYNGTTWGNGFANPAAWAASRSGQDNASLTSNPNLVSTPTYANNGTFKVQSGSPAINAGNTSYKSRLAFAGYAVTTSRDIGAYEFGSNP